MIRLRTIVSIAALAAALTVATPDASLAGSLLSGYGGPGGGNQAILGSALVNGPSGPDGKSGSGKDGSAGTSELTEPASSARESPGAGVNAGPAGNGGSTAVGQSAGTGGRRGQASARKARGAAGESTHGDLAGKGAGGAFDAYPASERGSTARLASEDAGASAFSSQDLLYALLVLVVLTFTGALTRWLTWDRRGSREQGS
jgi:hypothetical protein